MLVSYMPLANLQVPAAQRACRAIRCQLRHAVQRIVSQRSFPASLRALKARTHALQARAASEATSPGARARASDAQRLINEQRRNHGRRRQRPPRVSTDVSTPAAAPPTAAALREIQKRKRVASEDTDQLVDCYPYAFSPLLLFAPSAYFDRGYRTTTRSAQFFSGVLEVDMLTNVLADRKNMLYEELLEYVQSQQMLVTCCIDAHFTAFQCLERGAVVHYDPAGGGQKLLTGDGAQSRTSCGTC